MTTIPIEISARHVHLTVEDWAILFGAEPMTIDHPISQDPQFVAKQRVKLRGPKGTLERVGIVGPVRPYTQAELAMTDALRLGLKPPLSDSGHLEGAAVVTIVGPVGSIERAVAIIQQRHLHLNPPEAQTLGLADRQEISVQLSGPRAARLDNVLVRIHADYSLRLHLDTDEGNACGVTAETVGQLVV